MKQIQLFLLLISFFSFASCTTWWGKHEDDNPYQGVPPKQLLEEAEKALAKEQYDNAAKRLEAMDTLYPFNDYAERAQLELIFAYYQKNDYASAAATAERFIHLYPRSKSVDYAYYMKGLANFRQNRGILSDKLPLDESWRDSGSQAQAYSDFATLVQKFPESRYKPNALQRMIYLRNLFAQRELNTSRYYYQRRMYVAASERASYLVKNYPQAPSAEEALAIMYYSNKALGLASAAQDALSVYMATYHKSPASVRLS